MRENASADEKFKFLLRVVFIAAKVVSSIFILARSTRSGQGLDSLLGTASKLNFYYVCTLEVHHRRKSIFKERESRKLDALRYTGSDDVEWFPLPAIFQFSSML